MTEIRFTLLSFLLTGLLFCAGPLSAEVYSLWPFGPQTQGQNNPGDVIARPGSAAEILPGKNFWTEPIRVNGQNMQLNIELIEVPFTDAASILRKRYPDAVFALNETSLLLHHILKNGNTERIFLLNLSGMNPLLQFSIEIPKNRVSSGTAVWPKNLPIFDGAKNISVIQFPKRKSVFGSYFLPDTTGPQVISDIDSRLKSSGWQAASGETADVFQASGEVYLRDKPLEVLLLGTAPDPKGTGIMVSLYTRPLN